MFCAACGAEITAHGRFCVVCGAASAGPKGAWENVPNAAEAERAAKRSAAQAKRAAWENDHPDGQAFKTLMQPITIKHVSGSAAKTGANAKVQLCEGQGPRAFPAWQSEPDVPGGRQYELIGVSVNAPGTRCGLKILGGSREVSLFYSLGTGRSRFQGSTADPTQVDMCRISNNQEPENVLTSWSFGSAAQRDAWLAAIRRVESVVASEENARAFANFGGALWYPAMRGDVQRVAQLLQAGASYGIPDEKPFGTDLGPMHVAAECGHVGVMELLVDAGDSVNLQSINGQTPLHSAAMTGQVEAIQWLKARDADETLRCGSFSAWDYAKKYNHNEALKLLSPNTSGFRSHGGGGGVRHHHHYHSGGGGGGWGGGDGGGGGGGGGD